MMAPWLAVLWGVSLLVAGPPSVAVHYRSGLFGSIATARGYVWQATPGGVRVAGRDYLGFASSPVCGSRTTGGTLTATIRAADGTWHTGQFFQADVSAPKDRAAQLRGGRILEIDGTAWRRLGLATATGHTPARLVKLDCERVR